MRSSEGFLAKIKRSAVGLALSSLALVGGEPAAHAEEGAVQVEASVRGKILRLKVLKGRVSGLRREIRLDEEPVRGDAAVRCDLDPSGKNPKEVRDGILRGVAQAFYLTFKGICEDGDEGASAAECIPLEVDEARDPSCHEEPRGRTPIRPKKRSVKKDAAAPEKTKTIGLTCSVQFNSHDRTFEFIDHRRTRFPAEAPSAPMGTAPVAYEVFIEVENNGAGPGVIATIRLPDGSLYQSPTTLVINADHSLPYGTQPLAHHPLECSFTSIPGNSYSLDGATQAKVVGPKELRQ